MSITAMLAGAAGMSAAKAATAQKSEGIGSMLGASLSDMGKNALNSVGTGISSGLGQVVSQGLFGDTLAKQAGSAQRAHLDEAFPELNPWEKAGTKPDAPSAQTQSAEKLAYSQMKNQKEIALANNQTQKEIAGLQATTQMAINRDTLEQSAPLVEAQTAAQRAGIQLTEQQIRQSQVAIEKMAAEIENLKDAKTAVTRLIDDLSNMDSGSQALTIATMLLGGGLAGAAAKKVAPMLKGKAKELLKRMMDKWPKKPPKGNPVIKSNPVKGHGVTKAQREKAFKKQQNKVIMRSLQGIKQPTRGAR